jgi:hypothetical protein
VGAVVAVVARRRRRRRRPVNIPSLVLPVLSLVRLRYHKVPNWKWNFRISHRRLLAVAVAAVAPAPVVNPDVRMILRDIFFVSLNY